jgi:hypothetical protein
MQIDEARGHDMTRRLNFFSPWFGDHSDNGDDPLINCDISAQRFLSRSIDNKSIPDYEVMHGVLLKLLS